MKKLNISEKQNIWGGVSSKLGVIEGSVALIYAFGELLNLIIAWIPEKYKKKVSFTPQQQPKPFLNHLDGNQVTVFS